MQRPASYKEICAIASAATSVFESFGLTCCVTGDTACALYGTTRRPSELDIMVLTGIFRREKLEGLLVAADSDFYLWSPKDGQTKHSALCYKLPRQPGEHKRGCKVNILVPQVLNIPQIPSDLIQRVDDLPVMPLLMLLFLKLQNWTDRRDTLHWYMRSQQHDEDVKDIGDLVVIARSRDESISRDSLQQLPLTYVDAAVGRITEFVERYPSTLTNWMAIGYVQR